MKTIAFIRQISLFVFTLYSAVAFATDQRIQPEGISRVDSKPLVYGTHSMIVTNNPWASKTAAQILKQGGNAIDAAVAAAFVLGLTEPASSGIGGGGFALIYNKSKKQLTAYDGRETAPNSATPHLFMNKHLPMDFNAAMLSVKSFGVPGEVALLNKIQQQQGRIAWSRVVTPAIELAEKGFPLSPRLHKLLQLDRSILIKDTDVKALYFTPEGRVKPIHTIIKNHAYATSLKMIANHPRSFYTGKIARDIINKINRLAGFPMYTSSDMRNYAPMKEDALCSSYRTYQVCSIPFESGGSTVLELLKIYANNHRSPKGKPVNWMYHFLEASKLAYADYEHYIADPAFAPQPLTGLLDSNYLLKRSKNVTRKALITPVPAGIPVNADLNYAPDTSSKAPGTTSIAIVDRDGNAVSMTLTIEHQFGNHIFVDGFFLNNELTDFSFEARDLNGKLVANRVEPLKRPRSAITPVMVFDKKGDLIAITGSPGGKQIICYVAKNLIQMLDFKMNPRDSAASGNLCATNKPATLEKGSDVTQYIPQLKRRGEQITVVDLLSGVVNIKRALDGGWYGAADPRREGVAIGG